MKSTTASSPSESDVWQALADPTRREIVDRLAAGPKTTSQLCSGMPMSRFGVMKHLSVLERAGVVVSRKQGRFRLNHLNASVLHAVQTRWLSPRATSLAELASSFTRHLGETVMPNPAAFPHSAVIELALEWTVAASAERTWTCLFADIDRWWPASHRALGDGSTMRFAPRLGGGLTEEQDAAGGLLWYTVFAIAPQRSLDLVGHLASRYGGPVVSTLHIELVPAPDNQSCVVKLTDSAVGRIGPDMRQSMESGWQEILGRGFVEALGAHQA